MDERGMEERKEESSREKLFGATYRAKRGKSAGKALLRAFRLAVEDFFEVLLRTRPTGRGAWQTRNGDLTFSQKIELFAREDEPQGSNQSRISVDPCIKANYRMAEQTPEQRKSATASRVTMRGKTRDVRQTPCPLDSMLPTYLSSEASRASLI